MSKAKATTKAPKAMTFSAFVVTYAKDHDITDTTKAGKRLRSKIRGAYGKNDAVTKWLDGGNKSNRDGNRYGDVSPSLAKVLAAL
jgi:FPC/CPF motif-containing protein YcgG